MFLLLILLGNKWKKGDILQCYLDLNMREMLFGLNGQHLGLAFDNLDVFNGLCVALTMNPEQECVINFGRTRFKYPPSAPYFGLNAVVSCDNNKL